MNTGEWKQVKLKQVYFLTRQRSDRWRYVSSLWSSAGHTLCTTNDLTQSPYSCESAGPRGHMVLISASDWISHIVIYVTDRQVVRQTSSVNLSIISDFPLIRATLWRLFNASSDRRFRTNQRADSEYHLTNQRAERSKAPDQSESRQFKAKWPSDSRKLSNIYFESLHWPAVCKEQELGGADDHLQLPPVSQPKGEPR